MIRILREERGAEKQQVNNAAHKRAEVSAKPRPFSGSHLASPAERMGLLQKVQGPRPSLTQMILPQFKQLGAASRRAWRWAMHVQRRRAFSSAEGAREGFVCTSNSRIADSRSFRAVDWPCIGVPPEIVTLVFPLAGDAERDDGLESDISRPAAEGGSFGDAVLEETFELVVDLTLGS
jgi:hypothetical protein